MTRRLNPGPASLAGLRWLAQVGPAPLGAWAVAHGWGRAAVYAHAQRLQAAGWVETCARTRGEGTLVYASRGGLLVSGVTAAVVEKPPAPYTWPHLEGCAWTAAWLTARDRGLVGPREMLVSSEWRGELRWRERGESRKRGHRPDLAGRLPDGRLLPIEVELTEKSTPRLRAVLGLHASWIREGRSPAVMYVCANHQIAERVTGDGRAAGLSIDRGTLRVEQLSAIRQQAADARAQIVTDWHLAEARAA